MQRILGHFAPTTIPQEKDITQLWALIYFPSLVSIDNNVINVLVSYVIIYMVIQLFKKASH